MTPATSRRPRRIAAAAILLTAGIALSGCSQVVNAFNDLQGDKGTTVSTPTAAASPSMVFNSQFTYDGSVSMSSEIAPELELRLDVWAQDPKRTQEWTPTADKSFGFAVNVHDKRVDEKAVLSQKRRVYISGIQITSQTTQSNNQSQTPFQFQADPRTLVPSDTLRSDRGLLLNSFQGGLLVPTQTIRQLSPDTYGITLTFAMTVWVEGTANTDTSFQQQVVYQYLPIAIFPH